MGQLAKKTAQYLLSLGLMVLFLYWAFKNIDPAALWGSLSSISLIWIMALVLTTLLTLVLRAWRWVVLMRPFASHVSIWDATLALAICYTSNIAIPRSGELLRAFSLNWTRGTNISSVLATVAVERILDLIILIIFVGISVFLLKDRINEVFPWLGPISLLVLAGCIVALVCLALVSIYRDRALNLVERLLGRISSRLAAVLVRILETFLHGLEALHTPSAYLEIIASSVVLNVGYILIIYESFLAFGFTQSHGLDTGASLVIMALSAIGMTIPTPGGTGSYHILFGQGLILLYAIPETPALACATAVHAIANLTYLGMGVPALLLQRRKRTEKQDDRAEEVAI